MPNVSEKHAQALRDLKRADVDEKTRLRRKAGLMAEIKHAAGLTKSQRIKFVIDDKNSPTYLMIKDADTNEFLEPVVRKASSLHPLEVQPQPAYAPNFPAQRKVLPAMAGMGVIEAAASHRVGGAPIERGVPILKLGSLKLDDAAALLRNDGDGRETFTKSEGTMTDHLKIEGGRLYFVL